MTCSGARSGAPGRGGHGPRLALEVLGVHAARHHGDTPCSLRVDDAQALAKRLGHGEHERATEDLLKKLELERIPRLLVYNKLDLLSGPEQHALDQLPTAVATCALRRDTTRTLLRRIAEELELGGHLTPRAPETDEVERPTWA